VNACYALLHCLKKKGVSRDMHRLIAQRLHATRFEKQWAAADWRFSHFGRNREQVV
jgi:hypothetical protein